MNKKMIEAGTHEVKLNVSKLNSGTYFALLENSDQMVQSIKFTVTR